MNPANQHPASASLPDPRALFADLLCQTLGIILVAAALIIAALFVAPVHAQGLSDLMQQSTQPQAAPQRMNQLVAVPGQQSDLRRLSPSVSQFSYFAVSRPAPRTYAIHDLVTIVIREDTSIDFESELEAEKESEVSGGIRDLPRLNLSDLLNLQIDGSDVDPDILLDVEYDRSFSGEGEYSRRETMSARVQARIIDVKPNGTVVLEARKHIASDGETATMVATGTARVDDINANNEILSTQLYDLHVVKHGQGELRKSTKKGPLTKLLDVIFNF
ncbi:MAG: flagellar basal body L-ring protein FlgH [Planctomycetota bacterium]